MGKTQNLIFIFTKMPPHAPDAADEVQTRAPAAKRFRPGTGGSKLAISAKEAILANDVPSLIEIKRALPAHCFQSNVVRSLSYALRDLVMGATFVLAARALYLSDARLFFLALPAYAVFMGALFAGFFVIGHDCGHGSFSKYSVVNYIVGLIMHSLVFTPYTSWQLSHRKHHKNTGSISNDEIFMPIRRKDAAVPAGSDEPSSYNFAAYCFMMGQVWWGYLAVGVAPNQQSDGYHWNPFNKLFVGHVAEVCGSIAGVVAVAAAVFQWILYDGFAIVFFTYLIPVGGFAAFAVFITFLHHNEEKSIVWTDNEDWNYVKGNLNSVDRSMGPVFDWILHDILTHQIHHLFPKVPHYNLVEATKVFREKFPHLVNYSDEPFLSAFLRNSGITPRQALFPTTSPRL